MNIDSILKLKGIIEILLESESRVNEAKEVRYWHPLSLATYGVDEIIEALDSMCSFRTSMSDKTLEFERSFSQFQGSSDAVMVNSGSSADLLLSFLLTDPRKPLLRPGSEVLVPAVTWPTHIWSILMAGLTVRLVDVDPSTLNICPHSLESSISENTSAIFLVHLMGNPCDMNTISSLSHKHNLLILEDCCEALGAVFNNTKVGNFGVGGSFSFFFSHHMTTMEGGMITVSSPRHAEQLRILRAHGWLRNAGQTKLNIADYPNIDPRYAFVDWGFNVRPTEVQAGFGLRQLEKLPSFNDIRSKYESKFRSFLSPYSHLLSMPTVHSLATPSWLGLPLLISSDAPFSREQIVQYLEDDGIETRPIVTGNIARHPVSEYFQFLNESHLPGADLIHDNGFYIGLSPFQSQKNMDRLHSVFEEFLQKFI